MFCRSTGLGLNILREYLEVNVETGVSQSSVYMHGTSGIGSLIMFKVMLSAFLSFRGNDVNICYLCHPKRDLTLIA